MDAPSQSTTPKAQPRRQFSLRSLFALTFAVAITMTVGILCRGSKYLGAFSSPWTLAALAPLLFVWILYRGRFIGCRGFAWVAILLFAVSLCLPAISLIIFRSPGVIWGFYAFAISFAALPELFYDLIFLADTNDLLGALVYLSGAVANVAFLGALIMYVVCRRRGKPLRSARRAATLGAAFVLVDLALLAYSGDLHAVYPGFGCWLAAPLALALGARL